MIGAVAALAMCVLAPVADAAEGPFPVKFHQLNAIAGSETELVQAVRHYYLTQKALLDWDEELIRMYDRLGDGEQSAAKAGAMRERMEDMGEVCKTAHELYPGNSIAMNTYGEYLYDIEGDHLSAIELWHEAIEADPSYALPHNNLGIHYWHAGQWDEGFALLEKAIELDPDNADFLYNLTQIYLTSFPEFERRNNWSRQRVYEEAMKLSKRATELAPNDFELWEDYAVNFYAGHEYFDVKIDWDEAAQAWRRARAVARDMAEVYNTWINEARVWIRAEAWDKAEQCLNEALALWPTSAAALNLLEQVKERRG